MAKIFKVDAFTDQLFGGNSAAVVPLEAWIDDEIMQSIAMENNLSETAFIVPADTGYELRWFTPSVEVALCGHATLATAHVLFTHLGFTGERIDFITKQSGTLTVTRESDGKLSMSFPMIEARVSSDYKAVADALGASPVSLFTGYYSETEFDYMAVFASQQDVAAIKTVNSAFKALSSRGVIATARGATSDCDFVSRFFAPNYGIDEDPVTGSAHCLLAPYWGGVLDKTELQALQISARIGAVGCRLEKDKTLLCGTCVDYLQGEIQLPQ